MGKRGDTDRHRQRDNTDTDIDTDTDMDADIHALTHIEHTSSYNACMSVCRYTCISRRVYLDVYICVHI